MRVQTEGGEVIDLGMLETGLTVGITDYSKRTTDDFGVTTVVPRGFSRKMSVRLGVETDAVDALQRRLADLRATSALWIADERYQWLSAQGFYKDFSLDLPDPVLSYCTLTVEGLAETETVADAGGDPAPDNQASTLRLLQPVAITDGVLTATNVAEADYPVWSAGATYAAGDRRVRAHRIYESIVSGNIGHDPTIDTTRWIDVGPTNRWAMFDQAVGSATSAGGQIVVTLAAPSSITGLAALDVEATTVRVQAPGYDSTQPVVGGNASFLDLNVAVGGAITVTLAGGTNTGPLPGAGIWNDARKWSDTAIWADTPPSGALTSVGSLLIGRLTGLGITEASPTAGINDFSRKDTDEFGDVTVVERAWSKTMSAKALIRTDALDIVANRIASVRAQPSLWIGQAGLDSLTIYGFFKDVSIEVGEATSKLSLSIEGLSTAPPASGAGLPAITVPWSGVVDDDGTKPAPNATNSADPSSPFGVQTVAEVDAAITQAKADILSIQTLITDIQAGGAGDPVAAQALLDATIAARDIAIAARDTATAKAASADGSASAAAGSASTATTKATQAGNSATAAAGSVVTAQTARDAAVASATASDASATVATEQAAAATHQAELAAQIVDSATGTDNTVLIQQVDAASVSRDTALGTRATALEAQVAGTASSGLRSSIDDLSTSTATALGAAASRTSALEASVGGNSGNLITNTDFAIVNADGSVPGWGPVANMAHHQYGRDLAGDSFRPAPDHTLGLYHTNGDGDEFGSIVSDWVPCVTGHYYQASAYLGTQRCVARPFIQWGNGGSYLSDGPKSDFPADLNHPDYPVLESYARVASPVSQAPAGAALMRLVAEKNGYLVYPGATYFSSWVWLTRPMLAEATALQTAPQPYTPGSGAASAAALAARVVVTEGAVATASGKLGAYFNVDAIAGGDIARLSIYADNFAGGHRAGILLSAPNIALDGNVVVGGSLGLSKLARNQFGVFMHGAFSPGSSFATAPGTTSDLIVLSPGYIQDGGTFIFTAGVSMSANAGDITTHNYLGTGKDLYTHYISDGGVGIHVINGGSAIGYDLGGNAGEFATREYANTLGGFSGIVKVDVHNGNYDTGVIDQGDYYERYVSATYIVYGVDLTFRWTFN